MASLNSLLFLFSTLAPNMEPPVTDLPQQWFHRSVHDYGQKECSLINCLRGYKLDREHKPCPRCVCPGVPALNQFACHIGEYPSCKLHCQKNCSNYDQEIYCPDICVFGCVCIEPLIRGPDGSCIMPNECPATPDIPVTEDTSDESDDTQCPPDEELTSYAHCQRNCSNLGQMILCPGEGLRGCMCKSPMVRGPHGNCIMQEECPVIERQLQAVIYPPLSQTACRLGEYPSCKSHCQKDCTNYDQDIPCLDICVFDCVCIEPFVRGPDGSCIMPNECPATPNIPDTPDTSVESEDIQCEPDEEVSVFAHCHRNCTNLGETILCPGAGPQGCMCKAPKIRGPDGSCIRADECPRLLSSPQDADDPSDMKCPNNEEVSCFSHCQRNCTNFAKPFHCPMYCVTGCVCTPPLIRGPNGVCIMPEQCNAVQRSPQEVPDTSCQDDCDYSIDEENEIEMKLRSIAGPFDNLKFCEDKNEVYKVCSSQCPDNCKNYNDTRRACKMICLPLPKCECKEGFVRGPNGNCIAPEQCPHPEEVTELPCHGSEDCENNKKKDNENEIKLRSSAGPFDNFKMCEDENEVYKLCSSQCPDNCENYNDKRRACKLICLPLPKCECKEGFVRGPDGKCIAPEQCPIKEVSDRVCPSNEEYKACASPCEKNCQNYDDPLIIPCIFVCESGCFCKGSMVRGPDGDCIPKDECPAMLNQPKKYKSQKEKVFSVSNEVCPENEEYKECGTACQKNCDDYDKHIPCEFKCESGCFCEEPLIRGPSGRCIHPEECPAISNSPAQSSKNARLRFLPDFPKLSCKENEVFSVWAPLCPDDCTNYKEDRLCKRISVPGCKCIEGYVKGKDGNCIKKEDCEENKDNEDSDCSDLEEYKECGCEIDCNNYDVADRKCETSYCRPGCYCKTHLVRSPDGECIIPDRCPAPVTSTDIPTDTPTDIPSATPSDTSTDITSYTPTDTPSKLRIHNKLKFHRNLKFHGRQ